MKQRCNPIKTALVLAGSATLTIGSLAQPDSAAVTAALRTPVLGQVGNHSYEVISLLVRHADKAADQSWSLLDSPAALAAHQKDLRDKWLASFGGLPQRTPLNASVTATLERDGYRIEKVLFESQPGLRVTAHLFLPGAAFKPPYPATLISCGHSNDGKASKAYQRGAVMAAKAGLAVLIYDPIDQGERLQLPGEKPPYNVHGHNITGVSAMLLGWNTARFRIWDGMRALDYLQSRPDIDGRAFGVMGNSGGGTLSSYIMALDDRIGAGAPSCYISTLRDVCNKCGPQDAEQNFFGQLAFGLNHAGYLLARAPSPVCMNCTHGDFFPFAGSRKSLAVASELFGRFGWGERMAMMDVPGPHGWQEGTRGASIQWMQRWLAKADVALPLDVEHFRALSASYKEKEADCGIQGQDAWVTGSGQVRDLPGARSVYDIMREELEAIAKQRQRAAPAELARTVRASARLQTLASLRAERREVARHERPGFTEVHRIFARPSGIELPTVTLRPKPAAGAPALVLDSAGKSNCVAAVERCLKAGRTVMAADLTAQGEQGGSKHRFYGARNIDEGIAVMLYLLGESLVGWRAEDILICARALSEECGGQRVLLCARGPLAVAAAHAYAAEPQLFEGVELEDKPLSWSEVVRKSDRFSFAETIQSGLRHYDWTDLLP